MVGISAVTTVVEHKSVAIKNAFINVADCLFWGLNLDYCVLREMCF